MSSYEAKLENFQGPLSKLLELIEGRDLEISAISLSRVTEDFLNYLEAVKTRFLAAEGAEDARSQEHMQILADFLSVASRLVLLKSKSLIPTLGLSGDEQADLKDLEARLKSYAELKPLFKELDERWGQQKTLYARPYFLHLTASRLAATSSNSFFYPGETLTAENIQKSLGRIIAEWQDLEEDMQVVKEKIVSLEEQMKNIVERLQGVISTSFKNFSESNTRQELVVIFLALLHLARDQMVILNQDDQFSDILISKGGKLNTEGKEQHE